MELTLKVDQYQSQMPPQQLAHTFGATGGTIGRSAANDWTLDDPARFISGRHAQILLQNAQFMLKDLSTNGTFINGMDAANAIGKGNMVPLNEGDRLHIGEYVVSVHIVAAQTAAAPEPAADAGDWFDAPTESEAPVPAAASEPATYQPPEPERAAAPDDDWFGGLGSSSEDDNELFVPETPDVEGPDPFAPSQAPEQDFFVPPQVQGESQIPDDWDPMLSQITSMPNLQKVQAEAAPQPASPAPPAPAPPAQQPKAPPQQAPAQQVARPAQQAQTAAPAPSPPAQRQAPPQAPPPAMPGSGVQGGLGVDNLSVDSDTLSLEAGRALRVIVEGLMEILAGRAQVKDEFRLQQTRIGPAMNNPLKFSPNAPEAIRRLFGGGESGFLGAEDGLQQAIDDIKAHQVAMLAGMQAGLQAVLAFFEPKHLEEMLDESSGLASKMPGVREAKLWSQYTAMYDRMAKDAEGDFDRLFAKQFADAYESQIQMLSSARRNQGN